jgi:hypothetical protein
MSETTMGFDQTEEEILGYQVSDETLETAGGMQQGAFTLGHCTGLGVCDG